MMLGQGDIHRIDGGLDKRRNMALGSAYIRRGDDFQELLTGATTDRAARGSWAAKY